MAFWEGTSGVTGRGLNKKTRYYLEFLYTLPLCLAKSEILDDEDTLQRDPARPGSGLTPLATLEVDQNSDQCLSQS